MRWTFSDVNIFYLRETCKECNPDARRGIEKVMKRRWLTKLRQARRQKVDWMKLNMFSFDMSNINIFIAKSFFSTVKMGWHFLNTFILCHFTIDSALNVPFFVCLVIKSKTSETWKSHNIFRRFQTFEKAIAMSTVSPCVNLIEFPPQQKHSSHEIYVDMFV